MKLSQELRHLVIGVVGIGGRVLVTVEIKVNFVVHQHGHKIRCNIEIVGPPFGKHRMMLYSGFPDNRFVAGPTFESVVDPIHHFISFLHHEGIAAVQDSKL